MSWKGKKGVLIKCQCLSPLHSMKGIFIKIQLLVSIALNWEMCSWSPLHLMMTNVFTKPQYWSPLFLMTGVLMKCQIVFLHLIKGFAHEVLIVGFICTWIMARVCSWSVDNGLLPCTWWELYSWSVKLFPLHLMMKMCLWSHNIGLLWTW